LSSHGLVAHITSHLRASQDSHPLSEEHQRNLAVIAHENLHPRCDNPTACLAISPDQPFRLGLLSLLLQTMRDPDVALPSLLEEGVPTGFWPSALQPAVASSHRHALA
jgi:hypothetical protein